MGAFGDCSDPRPGTRRAGHAQDTCAWCVQLRETDAQARRMPAESKRSPVPVRVLPGPAPTSHASRRVRVVRTVLVVLAAATIIAATVAIVLDTRP